MGIWEKRDRLNASLKRQCQWMDTKIGGVMTRTKEATIFISPSAFHKGAWHITVQDKARNRLSIGEDSLSLADAKAYVERELLS